MAKVTLVMCVFVLHFVSSQKPESNSALYNSSDLSYLSNGIQFPAPVALSSDPVANRTTQNVTVMQYVSRLFDHHSWINRLSYIQNEKCRMDVTIYLQNLKNDTTWATKMFDASGHYSSQFFFGNDYWLGSSTLCWDLQNEQYNTNVPPFETKFFVAKVRLNYNEILTPVTRQINVGQCLPKSCNSTDVRTLMIQETVKGEMLSVIEVRPVPGTYTFLGDPKFLIVGGAFVAVGTLVIIASIVEYFMDRSTEREKEARVESNNNNNNNNNNNIEDKKIKIDKTKERKSGKALSLLLCFSSLTNGRKLLSFDSQTEDPIQSIHGLRCFSIFWIIMVHTYLQVFAIAANKTMRSVTERSFLYQTVSNATFSVDTFFFISGLLITITYLRISKAKPKPQKEETTGQAVKRGTLQFFMYLLYRYIRLTPVYMFALGLNEIVIRFTHDRSVFTPAIYDHYSCAAHWWRNALYINNFFPQTEFCMLWTWYMANDTQFYIVGIILLLIGTRGNKHQKFAITALGVFLASSWIITFIISMQYNLFARVEEPFTLFDQLYDKPWLRFGPYAVGMATGYILVNIKSVKMNPVVVILGWTIAAACALSLVYGLGSEGLKVPLSAIYSAFGHTAWGLCIAWIVISCYYGYGGPVNAVLSFRGLLPLSRITFCAYLIHPVVMVITSFQLDGPYHLHNSMVIITFFGNVVASFLIATVLSLLFEAPAIRLLKVILGSKTN